MPTFIDHVEVEVVAGSGGNGCVAFRREKFVPRGGPSGGDGGKGGNVVVQASGRVATLIDLRYQKLYRAEKGAHGRGSNQTGKSGQDTTILVPPGTIITDAESGAMIAELLSDGDSCVVAAGGTVSNVDVTLICEKPRLRPHNAIMVARVAEILGFAAARVSVKATTTEKLGFTGRGEGIAAQAIATVRVPD